MALAPTLNETQPAPAPRRRRRLELALAIFLGIVLGLAVVSAFVFLGSEGSIDAPRIHGVDTGKPAPQARP
jgi:uncharacterized membrane protein YagU involved in acid resistance